MPRPLACSSRKERTDQLEGVPGGLAWPRGAGWGGLVAQGGACWAPTPCPASALTHSHPGTGNGLSGHLVQTVHVPGRKHEPKGQETRRERKGQLCFLCEQSAPIPGRPPTPTTHGCSDGHPTWGEVGQHPEDPGVRPPGSRGRGAVRPPPGRKQRLPPSTSSGELTLPRWGDVCPHSTDPTLQWESHLSQSLWKMCLCYIK